MNDLTAMLKEMDFDYFGSGKHCMSPDALAKKLNDGNMIILDVRTGKEAAHVAFPFAKHIPLNELPDRMNELPKDKLIVPFCSSVFRGVIAYVYLRSQGYPEVKALSGSLEDMIKHFKPGPLAKQA